MSDIQNLDEEIEVQWCQPAGVSVAYNNLSSRHRNSPLDSSRVINLTGSEEDTYQSLPGIHVSGSLDLEAEGTTSTSESESDDDQIVSEMFEAFINAEMTSTSGIKRLRADVCFFFSLSNPQI